MRLTRDSFFKNRITEIQNSNDVEVMNMLMQQ